jgi:hypothetical protein
MITKLQDKFKKGRGALPKDVEMPVLDDDIKQEEYIDEEELKKRALKKVPQKDLMFINKEQNKENKENERKKVEPQDEAEELEILYQEVEREIEDRQQYLEEIAHLDEPKIKERVKKEIVERVSELEKIIRMMHKS